MLLIKPDRSKPASSACSILIITARLACEPPSSVKRTSSLLAVIYVWRVVETAYFQKPDEDADQVKEAPLQMQISMWTLTLATLYFGVSTDLTAGVASRAAQWLLGVTP